MSHALYSLFRVILFLPTPASKVARHLDRLHFFVISTTMIGSFAVFLVGTVFIVKYRRRSETEATPRVQGSMGLEAVVWGGLLGLFIFWWVLGFRQYVWIETAPKQGYEVYVTAKQWMWKFTEPNGRSSAGVLVAPRGQTLRLIITSRDVVHSFYVPNFRVKQDAVPGIYTTIWIKPDRDGTYPIYCAEYCGLSHSRMWATLVVVEPEDYQRWLNGEVPEAVAKAGLEPTEPAMKAGAELIPLADKGRAAATKHACFSCHTVDGQTHIGPTWLGLYGSMVELEDGTRVRADESYLTESMMDPKAKVVKGFKPVMPTFRGVLAQPDAAAIVEYIKSLKDVRRTPAVNLPPVHPEEADAGFAEGGPKP